MFYRFDSNVVVPAAVVAVVVAKVPSSSEFGFENICLKLFLHLAIFNQMMFSWFLMSTEKLFSNPNRYEQHSDVLLKLLFHVIK